jgi:hypothetical protein
MFPPRVLPAVFGQRSAASVTAKGSRDEHSPIGCVDRGERYTRHLGSDSQ